MIASLNGQILAQGSGYLIIEVAGIGYQVLVTEDLARRVHLGDSLSLHTKLIVREDSLTLYGFLETSELDMFEELLKVSGVGPKSALAVLNDLSIPALVGAIHENNEKAFQSVSGVGPKTARLIIATLQGRLDQFTSVPSVGTNLQLHDQLLAALVSLGWTERDSQGAIERLKEQGIFDEDYPLPELLKLALVGLGSAR